MRGTGGSSARGRCERRLHPPGQFDDAHYRPLLVEDAIGFIDENDREHALDHADWLFGEVTTLDDVELA
jgi:hypothetical protein